MNKYSPAENKVVCLAEFQVRSCSTCSEFAPNPPNYKCIKIKIRKTSERTFHETQTEMQQSQVDKKQ